MKRKRNAPPPRLWRHVFATSWWVFLFCAACVFFHGQAVREKDQLKSGLEQRLSSLEEDKKLALQDREDLLLQIESQSDPAWIQMTLMKGLGVVPEGQMKVYFKGE